jgi:hypothetical protein
MMFIFGRDKQSQTQRREIPAVSEFIQTSSRLIRRNVSLNCFAFLIGLYALRTSFLVIKSIRKTQYLYNKCANSYWVIVLIRNTKVGYQTVFCTDICLNLVSNLIPCMWCMIIFKYIQYQYPCIMCTYSIIGRTYVKNKPLKCH